MSTLSLCVCVFPCVFRRRCEQTLIQLMADKLLCQITTTNGVLDMMKRVPSGSRIVGTAFDRSSTLYNLLSVYCCVCSPQPGSTRGVRTALIVTLRVTSFGRHSGPPDAA